jgi:hypothetical protein
MDKKEQLGRRKVYSKKDISPTKEMGTGEEGIFPSIHCCS